MNAVVESAKEAAKSMSYPVIFSHYGYQPYLDYTLSQARRTNPDSRLIILGDISNYEIATDSGWEHYNFERFTGDLHRRFKDVFVPIFSQKTRLKFSTDRDAELIYLKWIRYVTERWFFIESFLRENAMDRFWHFDSDTMILKELSLLEEKLSPYDYTSQCNNACLNGFIKTAVANEFCTFICELYENKSFIAEQQALLDDSSSDHAFTEMSAFRIYQASSNRKYLWLMDIDESYVFDDCLCQDHGFQTTKLPFGRAVKAVRFENGSAFGKKDGEDFEFITLNLSWLPTFAYKWVKEAQEGAACADIRHLHEDDKFARIGLSDVSPSRSAQGNSYCSIRDSICVNLKALHKNLRKRLVTFTDGYEKAKKAKNLAINMIEANAFDVVDNWTLGALKNTQFYADNHAVFAHNLGPGNWLWKPYIVSRALQASDDGDLIIYCDIESHSKKISEMAVLSILSWLSAHDRRFVICHTASPNSDFTKRDCFYFMDCDHPQYWSYCHYLTNCFAFIANTATRKFISDWLDYCVDERILSDNPNTCGLPDFSNFSAHKFDSSVLSNLIVRHNFTTPILLIGSHIASNSIECICNRFEEDVIKEYIIASQNCLSDGKKWLASSGSEWSLDSGEMANIAEDAEFFFHTSLETNPWFLIDLNVQSKITMVMIINRPTHPYGNRASRLRVYIGSQRESLSLLYDAEAADWDLYKPLIVSAGGSVARYVKITIVGSGVLHLKDVKVFGIPGK